MASHLLWFRLPKGRVWHVACSGALVALCGQSIPARGERQPKRPPFGARPCPDCDLVAAEAWKALYDARAKHAPNVGTAIDPTAAFSFVGATLTAGSLHFDEGQEFRRDELKGLIAYPLGTAKEVRLVTDPEDDGELPDLLGQDGEVRSV